jgi:hypothetical protein
MRSGEAAQPEQETRSREASSASGPFDIQKDREGRHLAPLGTVAIAVAFNLWVLRAELLPVLEPNDNAVHLSMVRWATERIQAGHLPFDGWFANLGLGSPLFHQYQSLPHILTGALGVVIGPDRAFFGVLYVLLASWPISIYIGARLLGWERWVAAGAAFVSPLLLSAPGYGFEDGSYTWNGGLGLWSQLWAMWLLPVALGLTWRAVSARKPNRYALAALLLGLTAACHFLTGYLAFLALGVWVVIDPKDFLKRLGRAALVGVGGLLIISWVVVPLLLDGPWISQSTFRQGTVLFDSFGARRVLTWLVTGQLFDAGRAPVITILVGLGMTVCIARFRYDERARAVLGFMLLSLLLFFGRPTLGVLLRLLPGSDDLLLHRYIIGVHLAGIILAGVGVAWIGPRVQAMLYRLMSNVRPIMVRGLLVLLGLTFLSPAWGAAWVFTRDDGGLIRGQRIVDAAEGADVRSLVEEARTLGPGRIYAGSTNNWGFTYRLGGVPMYAALLAYGADGVGFLLRTTSLSSDFEAVFDDTDPAQYALFGIRYLILPVGRGSPVPATLLNERGPNALWEVHPTDYVNVVDSVSPTIRADRTDLLQRASFFLRSDLLAEGRYPTIAFAGREASPPTLPAGEEPIGPAGVVRSESDAISDGAVTAIVVAHRAAVVVLKSTFEPRWTVTVDGVSVRPLMVAPSFVGATVTAGTHSVEFLYRPFPDYAPLFAIGVLTLVSLGSTRFLPARVRARRGSHRDERG